MPVASLQQPALAFGARQAQAPKPTICNLAGGKCMVYRTAQSQRVARSISTRAEGTNGGKPFRAWETGVSLVAKRTDLKRIMIIGAGPIVIGQVL